jgi:hypothetical protein
MKFTYMFFNIDSMLIIIICSLLFLFSMQNLFLFNKFKNKIIYILNTLLSFLIITILLITIIFSGDLKIGEPQKEYDEEIFCNKGHIECVKRTRK